MLGILTALAVGMMALCSVFGWTFVILYSRVRWYATPEGRHLMRFTIELSLVFSLSLLNVAVHMKPITAAVLSVVLFGLIAWDLATRIGLHLRAKRERDARVAG